ncbi:MAG: hypothetical protein ABI282_11250 [Candidatus Baltobacteraceae bacterium]
MPARPGISAACKATPASENGAGLSEIRVLQGDRLLDFSMSVLLLVLR